MKKTPSKLEIPALLRCVKFCPISPTSPSPFGLTRREITRATHLGQHLSRTIQTSRPVAIFALAQLFRSIPFATLIAGQFNNPLHEDSSCESIYPELTKRLLGNTVLELSDKAVVDILQMSLSVNQSISASIIIADEKSCIRLAKALVSFFVEAEYEDSRLTENEWASIDVHFEKSKFTGVHFFKEVAGCLEEFASDGSQHERVHLSECRGCQ